MRSVESLEKARAVVQSGYQDVRMALHALRSIDRGRTTGLPAIARLISTFREVTGVAVDVHYTNAPLHLERETDLALYHVIQESLVNAFRHGSATQVEVLLSSDRLGGSFRYVSSASGFRVEGEIPMRPNGDSR